MSDNAIHNMAILSYPADVRVSDTSLSLVAKVSVVPQDFSQPTFVAAVVSHVISQHIMACPGMILIATGTVASCVI